MFASFNSAPFPVALASAFHGMADRWQRTQARRRRAAQVRRELEAHTARELADMGLCRSDIPDIVRAAYHQA